MARKVRWKSGYKGPDDDKKKRIRIGVGAGVALAVLIAGAFAVSHFAGTAARDQEGVIEILGEDEESDSQTSEPETQEPEENGEMDQEASSDSTAADDEGTDETQEITDFSSYDLEKDAYPQVNELIGAYFQAKIDQDPAALYQVFGKADDGNMDFYRKELKAEAAYVQDYEDVTCYTRKGLTEDSYLVYVIYDVKFRRVDTLAPGIMWCYVVKGDDGRYVIRENVIGDEADYVAEQNQTEGVRLLNRQVKAKLKAAIESDSLLAGIYKGLSNGAVVTGDISGDGTDTDSQVQILDGAVSSEEAENSEAETTEAGTQGDTSQPESAADPAQTALEESQPETASAAAAE